MTKNIILENYFSKNFSRNSKIKFLKFDKIINEIKSYSQNSNNFYEIFKNRNLNIGFKNLNKFKRFNNIAIIGMGGSILGSEAIYDFLKFKIKKKVFFFNNMDYNEIKNFRKKNNLNKTLFIVISKSGNTLETLTNFIYLNIIKKNSKNIIVITEKKNNDLFNLCKKFNLSFIEHRDYVGGRFSVLTEVGLVPAYLMGINIFNLRKNSKKILSKFNKIFFKTNLSPLAEIFNKKNFKNLIFINYIPELEKFLYWCQQLISESLGKKGKGFLPMISSSPKDHHSLLQLYLDGPKDKLFYIFSLNSKKGEKVNFRKYLNKNNYLQNQNINQIKKAQKEALLKTFKIKKIPFREFKVKEINEVILGELFCYFMLETIILGKLSNINPFDQPAVEQVKKITKSLLS